MSDQSEMLNPFVSPPFIECPKCREIFFGVIGFGEFGYNRRCAKCSYPTPPEPSYFISLPKLNKKIIYLDQCILSRMVKTLHPDLNKADQFASSAFEMLDRLSKLQLIVCPDSHFHEEESIFSATPNEHKRVFELLSHGISYVDMWTIFRHEVYEQLQKWFESREMGQTNIPIERVMRGKVNEWQGRLLITVNSKRVEMAKPSLENTKNAIFADMKPVFERWERESGKNFNYWYQQEISHWPFSIADGYKKYLQQMVAAMSGGSIEQLVLGPTPFFSTFKDISEYLDRKIENIEERMKRLNEFMSIDCLEKVPFIRIYTSLMATIAVKVSSGGMKKENIEPSFFNDILMISSILPFCDAIFLERQMAGFLRESPLNQVIDKMPRIFSSSNKNEFFEYLQAIEGDASKEHIMAVEEVYGSEWGKPFTSVLQEYKTKSARKDE
ncbi:hypothetical protein [Bdellovibrio sp. HCB337]|uniref:hypothetical protein n=1 Tax=Bdellovibrio sp. HCB337 TaxID=3394358 RepID=UPI0039A7143B